MRPITTLFMLMSVDWKISTGNIDERDFDKDFPRIPWIKEGLPQYYTLEQKTELWSLNSSKVMKKIGMNEKSNKEIEKTIVNFVLIDNGELTIHWIKNMAKKSNTLCIATTKEVNSEIADNIIWEWYDKRVDMKDYFQKLYQYGCEKLTIQTGSSINAELLKNNLIDYIFLVVAPCLIGGKETPSLLGGLSHKSLADLEKIKSLELLECSPLENSYLYLKYRVNNWNK